MCVRRRWAVIAVWLVVAVGLHLWAASLGQQWNDNLTLPGTGSTRATDLLQQKLPQQAYGSIPLTLLGWALWGIHALFVVNNHYAEKRNDRLIRAVERNRFAA